jgi:hypothetical protein
MILCSTIGEKSRMKQRDFANLFEWLKRATDSGQFPYLGCLHQCWVDR